MIAAVAKKSHRKFFPKENEHTRVLRNTTHSVRHDTYSTQSYAFWQCVHRADRSVECSETGSGRLVAFRPTCTSQKRLENGDVDEVSKPACLLACSLAGWLVRVLFSGAPRRGYVTIFGWIFRELKARPTSRRSRHAIVVAQAGRETHFEITNENSITCNKVMKIKIKTLSKQ